jgi:hypothetical protein
VSVRLLKGKVFGAAEMINTMKRIALKFPDKVMTALYQEAQIEVTEMKRRCPVDTTPNAPHPGNLRNSIHAEPPERNGRTLSVTVATGVQAPYAIYVHENPDAFHPVGEWKFMESVIKESAPHMGARIAARVNLNERD